MTGTGSESFEGTVGPAADGCPSSGTVGEVGLYRECRCFLAGVVIACGIFSSVTGSGCIDLRRDALLLLGFMWNDLRDIALRRPSDSPCAKNSFSGDCGAGEESRDVLQVPGPEVEVAVDMKEKRERPRS